MSDPVARPAETFAEAEDALLSRWPETRLEPSLDRIQAFTELLGDPQRSFRSIHLTGTNGKTSTSRMIDALLRALDLRTGRFTSPHVERMSERISIDGEPLSDEDFVRVFNEIAPYTHLVDEQEAHPLSFFETVVGMAYAAFADAPVDVGVVEVGMGGTWDATNVIDADVAVITPIAMDHANYLGGTPEAIAQEKSGIIKPGATVVKAFNNIYFQHLATMHRPAGAPDRNTLMIAGDDEAAKQAVTAFIDAIGYDVFDTGSLADSWRFQRDQAAYAGAYTAGDMAAYDATDGVSGVAPQLVRAIQVFDPLGGAHNLQLAFLRDPAANTWNVEIYADPAEVEAADHPNGLLATGTVALNGDGTLASTAITPVYPAATLGAPIGINWLDTSGPDDSSITFDAETNRATVKIKGLMTSPWTWERGEGIRPIDLAGPTQTLVARNRTPPVSWPNTPLLQLCVNRPIQEFERRPNGNPVDPGVSRSAGGLTPLLRHTGRIALALPTNP